MGAASQEDRFCRKLLIGIAASAVFEAPPILVAPRGDGTETVCVLVQGRRRPPPAQALADMLRLSE